MTIAERLQARVLGAQVGWGSRPLERVKQAYENSYLVMGVIQKTEGPDGAVNEVLIGFARATSDHAFNATIWDVSPLCPGNLPPLAGN